MKCRICNSKCTVFDTALVRNKYKATYVQCTNCSFISVETPTWLEEAYSQPINASDTGYVARNQIMANRVGALAKVALEKNPVICDYGGGYGLLVRMLRDRGMDAWLYEPLTTNLFAPGFSTSSLTETGDGKQVSKWSLVTAFEVLEHLVDPIQTVAEIMTQTDSLLFSTELQPKGLTNAREWYYFGLSHGQHVSLFSSAALCAMAERLGVQITQTRQGVHLLSRRKIVSPTLFKILLRVKVATALSRSISSKAIESDRNSILKNDEY